MHPTTEQFATATKALLESQIGIFHALGNQAIDSVEKSLVLNVAATKDSVDNCVTAATQLSSAETVQECFSIAAAQAKPAVETVAAYGHDLNEIVVGMWAEFMNVAETQFATGQGEVPSCIEDKQSPSAGPEQVEAILKSAVGQVNAGAGQLMKTTIQAVETLEAHTIKTAEQFLSITK
jgi:phasin family protein